jgi:hypothetical protein
VIISFHRNDLITNPSTVRRAVNRLLKLGILFESSGEYRFVSAPGLYTEGKAPVIYGILETGEILLKNKGSPSYFGECPYFD